MSVTCTTSDLALSHEWLCRQRVSQVESPVSRERVVFLKVSFLNAWPAVCVCVLLLLLERSGIDSIFSKEILGCINREKRKSREFLSEKIWETMRDWDNPYQ